MQNYDPVVYEGYGASVRDGQTPYRDFALVYPPGALPVFITPTFVAEPGDLAAYRTWFDRLMAGCGVLCLVLVAAMRAPGWGIAFVAVSPLLVGSLVDSRFDLWPALLVIAAVAAFVRDRQTAGFAFLAAAFSAKLFAIVLVPLAIVWTVRRSGLRALRRGLATWIVTVAAAFGPFIVLAPHGLWRSIDVQLSRPIQIESLAGSALITFGHPSETMSLGAVSIAGDRLAADTSTLGGAVVLLALWVSFARGLARPERFVRYCAASVCAFIAFGTVLSPQFLIWLVPLVAVVRGRRGLLASGLLALALIATQWYFPGHYLAVQELQLGWFVFLRDLVLVAVLLTLSLPRRVIGSSTGAIVGSRIGAGGAIGRGDAGTAAV